MSVVSDVADRVCIPLRELPRSLINYQEYYNSLIKFQVNGSVMAKRWCPLRFPGSPAILPIFKFQRRGMPSLSRPYRDLCQDQQLASYHSFLCQWRWAVPSSILTFVTPVLPLSRCVEDLTWRTELEVNSGQFPRETSSPRFPSWVSPFQFLPVSYPLWDSCPYQRAG